MYLYGFLLELAEYLTYVRKLNFNENPNYTMLKDLFKSAMQKKGLEDDLNYDWIEKKKLVLFLEL